MPKAALLLDDGSTIGLGDVDLTKGSTPPLTMPRAGTIIGAILWPDGVEEGIRAELTPETMKAGDVYTLTHMRLT